MSHPASTKSAFKVTFVGTVATGWLCFDKGEHAGVHRITHAVDPGRRARVAYTCMHLHAPACT